MNLFKKDEKSQTAKNHQVENTPKLDSQINSSKENNDAPAPKAYFEAKPHKDLLSTSKSDGELHSKNTQATQGVKQ